MIVMVAGIMIMMAAEIIIMMAMFILHSFCWVPAGSVRLDGGKSELYSKKIEPSADAKATSD